MYSRHCLIATQLGRCNSVLPGELSGEHCGLLMYEIRSGTENEMCS